MIHGHLKVSKTLSGGLQTQNSFHLYTDILLSDFFAVLTSGLRLPKLQWPLAQIKTVHTDDILGDKRRAHIKHLFIPKYSGWSKQMTVWAASWTTSFLLMEHHFHLREQLSDKNYSDSDVCIWQTFSKINEVRLSVPEKPLKSFCWLIKLGLSSENHNLENLHLPLWVWQPPALKTLLWRSVQIWTNGKTRCANIQKSRRTRWVSIFYTHDACHGILLGKKVCSGQDRPLDVNRTVS